MSKKMPQIHARVGTTASTVTYDVMPDTCPLCHHGVEPKQFDAAILTGTTDSPATWLEIIYQCARHTCARFFIGRYSRTHSSGPLATREFRLKSVVPKNFVAPSIASEVVKVSTAFQKIYSQSAAAEAQGLDAIAGVGYRKSLEFLVKDYCITEHPNDADAIKKEFLGKCIETRVSDTGIKECAKRAAWLGNDETHYVRRWEDKDINDLKILIELTMNWIRSSVLTKRYLDDMDSPA